MLKDIVEVKPLDGYRLYLRFEDGVEGEIDLGEFISFDGVFKPLKNPTHFAQVKVNKDFGSICWPSGADLDPDALYARLSRALPC